MEKIIEAGKIFTGTEWLYNQTIVIENGSVKSMAPSGKNIFVDNDAETFLAPAFVDFQVYGAAGKLFSAYPHADTLQQMQEVFARQGTCLFQPTLATNSLEVFKKAIDAVKAYWSGGGGGVHGLHLEGPWINKQRRGAHMEEFIHAPQLVGIEELLAYGSGVIKTITLAPEVCDDAIIEIILNNNIVIAAGHSNVSYAQAKNSFKKGIGTVTHLYNAMSPLHHREPGLVGAVLQDEDVTASIIPDGHHVHYQAIAIAKKLMGDRLFAITDAVTETTEGPYRHELTGDKYECDGTLSGSAISMFDACYNLVNFVGIEIEEALRMCALYPARVMQMQHLYGKIAPGFVAQFLVIDKQLKLVDVIA